MSIHTPPFTYPGITIEPSMYLLYKDNREGRFRLGNQYVTKEWKDNLATIAWDALPAVAQNKIQTFIQAQLGYAFHSFHSNIETVHAFQFDGSKSTIWYCMIQQDNLDDIVVLRLEFKQNEGSKDLYHVSLVEFVGYTPKDKLGELTVHKKPTTHIRTSEPADVNQHTLATNMLHRNFIPSSMLTLDTTSVKTLGTKDHATFSPELEQNWPTTIHPDSTKKG